LAADCTQLCEQKYYSWSYGSKYAPSEGAGWVNELLARLTNTPVQDSTTTNSTLDRDPATFPIGPSAPFIVRITLLALEVHVLTISTRQFADFSSDNNIMKILAAMGVLRDPMDPPPSGPIPPTQQTVVSKAVPFASCTVVEKIACSINTREIRAGNYVRVVVNDAILPLPSCGSLGHTSGLCSLGAFVQSQAFSRAGGSFSSCFAHTDYVGRN
jgi:hypothetical protein